MGWSLVEVFELMILVVCVSVCVGILMPILGGVLGVDLKGLLLIGDIHGRVGKEGGFWRAGGWTTSFEPVSQSQGPSVIHTPSSDFDPFK